MSNNKILDVIKPLSKELCGKWLLLGRFRSVLRAHDRVRGLRFTSSRRRKLQLSAIRCSNSMVHGFRSTCVWVDYSFLIAPGNAGRTLQQQIGHLHGGQQVGSSHTESIFTYLARSGKLLTSCLNFSLRRTCAAWRDESRRSICKELKPPV